MGWKLGNTITRPNGRSDVREVRWGWEVIATVVSAFIAIGAAWVSVNRDIAAMTAEVQGLRHELDMRVQTSERAHERFVTRDELKAWMERRSR